MEIHHLPHIAQLLLHHTYRLKVRRMIKGVATQEEELDEVAGDVPTGHVESTRQMRQSKSFVNRTNVGNAISTVYHNTS